MPLVVDASVAASWAFDDEDHPTAALALERSRTEEIRVPCLWWFEVRDVLMMSERRKRIATRDVAVFLHSLSRLGTVVDHAPDETQILALTRRHRLSVYDAAYLELARREHLQLATLDEELIDAARSERVSLLGS
jgi:predicted nucleic acid-binding protein